MNPPAVRPVVRSRLFRVSPAAAMLFLAIAAGSTLAGAAEEEPTLVTRQVAASDGKVFQTYQCYLDPRGREVKHGLESELSDGKKLNDRYYRHGVLHGPDITYYPPTGDVTKRGQWVDGRRDGRWEGLGTRGEIRSLEIYDRGRAVSPWRYWEQGVLVLEEDVDAGGRATKRTLYFDNGAVGVVESYGPPRQREWFPRKIGTWTYRNREGQVLAVGVWNNDGEPGSGVCGVRAAGSSGLEWFGRYENGKLIERLTFNPRGQNPVAPTLNVAAEREHINDAYHDATRTTSDEAIRAAAEKSRKAALARLVERAEAYKSQDHALLAQIYAHLERTAEAVREARAAIAANKTDHSHVLLVNLLSAASKLDEADQAFADARSGLIDPSYLSQPHDTLATAYARSGRDDDVVRVTVLLLDTLWPLLARQHSAVDQYLERALDHLAWVALRTKSAEKTLSIVERFEQRLADPSVADKYLAPIGSTFRWAKIRILVAAGRQEAARQIALEDEARSEKHLAAEPKNADALTAVILARQRRFLAVDQGDVEEYLLTLDGYFKSHVEEHPDAEPLLIPAGHLSVYTSRKWIEAGGFDVAPTRLEEWISRLEKLDLTTPAAKSYRQSLSDLLVWSRNR